jgi:hypothetical protein
VGYLIMLLTSSFNIPPFRSTSRRNEASNFANHTVPAPLERISSVYFQANPTRSFLTLFRLYIAETFLEPADSRDVENCSSLEGIKAANVSSTELDNYFRGLGRMRERPIIQQIALMPQAGNRQETCEFRKYLGLDSHQCAGNLEFSSMATKG